MNDDEDPLISFSEEEKGSLPDSDAALHILIAAARQCYRFLNPATSGIDEQTCWTHYVHSNNCAFQVIQRIDRLGAVNLDALCAKIDIPHIEDTLPILVTAYEKCRSIWTDIYTGYAIGSHMILDDIGEKNVSRRLEQKQFFTVQGHLRRHRRTFFHVWPAQQRSYRIPQVR